MTEMNRVCDIDCEILTTERLIIRQPHRDDAEDMALLANNFEIAKNLARMPYPYFDADARDFLKKITLDADSACTFAITKSDNGRFIGVCGLHDATGIHEHPYMGYWIGEPYWGQGYATEAAGALIDLYFKTTSRDTMMASCMSINDASRRVIEKCGGKYWKSEDAFSNTLGKNQKIDKFRISRSSWMEALAA
ncbi:MAG: GNAT family N-acetyltransferase [Rhizobiaceae bacterium]|nr:GNAT family N-acetyltransferase [Rhizobiaceae bacterium]